MLLAVDKDNTNCHHGIVTVESIVGICWLYSTVVLHLKKIAAVILWNCSNKLYFYLTIILISMVWASRFTYKCTKPLSLTSKVAFVVFFTTPMNFFKQQNPKSFVIVFLSEWFVHTHTYTHTHPHTQTQTHTHTALSLSTPYLKTCLSPFKLV